MSADQIIKEIRGLSTPEDLDRVRKALKDHRAEVIADQDAARRLSELRQGKVKAVTHDEVYGSARNRLREA